MKSRFFQAKLSLEFFFDTRVWLCLLFLMWGLTADSQPTLEVDGPANLVGPLQLDGDPGVADQVLVSTGSQSAPQWMSVGGGGTFYATMANNSVNANASQGRAGFNLSSGTTQEDSLDFSTVILSGSDFSVITAGTTGNKITINRTGLYHFEGVIRYFVTSDLSVNLLSRATLEFASIQPALSDPAFYLAEDPMSLTGSSATGNSVNNYNATVKFQFNIRLAEGTTCTFITGFNLLRFPGGTDLIALGISAGGYIAGHFISG
ncbi:MAG: hypothetical protein IPL46_28990 [Saprospiraceae bacterium]|nr:hypothetical protein [Saprospiraceae bacterium]